MKSGSAQVQILLTACWRFAMVRTFNNRPIGNEASRPSLVNHSGKTIHHHHHHYRRMKIRQPRI